MGKPLPDGYAPAVLEQHKKGRSMRRHRSLGNALADGGGYGPGFDLLRHAAALTVLVSHAFPITTGNYASEPVHALTQGRLDAGTLAVYVFFAISGFLITQSADRSRSLASFARKRVLRIMPGMVAVILLVNGVLGPIVTTLPLADYVASPELWRNFGPLLFLPNPDALPGVFKHNISPGGVNISLWTLRYEVACYTLIAIGLLYPLRRGGWPILVLLFLFWVPTGPAPGLLDILPGVLQRLFPLAACFFSGAALYLFRNRIPLHPAILALSLEAVGASIVWFPFGIAGPIALAYAVIAIGFRLPARWRLHRDYSYGIYLWAFPIQQTLQFALPSPWWGNALMALPIVLVAAALSWHLLERRALAWKTAVRTIPKRQAMASSETA